MTSDALDILRGRTFLRCAGGHRLRAGPYGWVHTVVGEWRGGCSRSMDDPWFPMGSLVAFEVYDDE